MWVCKADPVCLCNADDCDPYSCDCTALHIEGSGTGRCLNCQESMVLIDADTGQPVLTKAS